MHRIQAAMKVGDGALVQHLLVHATENMVTLPLPFASTEKCWLALVANESLSQVVATEL